MGISKVYLNAVNGLRLVFLFCLEDKLLEDGIGTGDNTGETEGGGCLDGGANVS